MATRTFIAAKSGIASGTAAKTLIQVVAAANHALRVREMAISFNCTSNTNEPVLVELVRQTDAGTMSALTLAKGDDSVADTIDATAQHTATAEPTTTDILWNQKVHPQVGLRVPVSGVMVGAGDCIGLRVTSANNYTNTVAELKCEE